MEDITKKLYEVYLKKPTEANRDALMQAMRESAMFTVPHLIIEIMGLLSEVGGYSRNQYDEEDVQKLIKIKSILEGEEE